MTQAERDEARRAHNEKVPFDWQIVKVEQLHMVGDQWRAKKKIATCGVFYLYDANRDVHICSFTPSAELWPVAGYATFTSQEAGNADEGETENEMLQSEESVVYMDRPDVERLPRQPASEYVDPPTREDDEDCETYYKRAIEKMSEYLQGNPPWFDEKEEARGQAREA